jgi:hypothetical protein
MLPVCIRRDDAVIARQAEGADCVLRPLCECLKELMDEGHVACKESRIVILKVIREEHRLDEDAVADDLIQRV